MVSKPSITKERVKQLQIKGGHLRPAGEEKERRQSQWTAQLLGMAERFVLVCSTVRGVQDENLRQAEREGERFPKENVGGNLPRCRFGRGVKRSWSAWSGSSGTERSLGQ